MTTWRIQLRERVVIRRRPSSWCRSAGAQEKVTRQSQGLGWERRRMRVRGFCHRSLYDRLGSPRLLAMSKRRRPSSQAFVATYGRGVLEPAKPEGCSWGRRKKRAPGFCYKSRPAIRVHQAPEIEMSRRFDLRKHHFRMVGAISVLE